MGTWRRGKKCRRRHDVGCLVVAKFVGLAAAAFGQVAEGRVWDVIGRETTLLEDDVCSVEVQ